MSFRILTRAWPSQNSKRISVSALLSRSFSELSSQSERPSFGIAFDIDGVILLGNSPVGGSPAALRRLYDDAGKMEVPYVFLTNGGGFPESRRAFDLSQLLGLNISSSQVIQGHSPFKQLVNRFENELIVAVGKGKPAAVMSDYGFKNVISIDEYASCFEHIDPLAPYKKWTAKLVADQNSKLNESALRNNVCFERVQAAFVVSDPVDWSRDIQSSFLTKQYEITRLDHKRLGTFLDGKLHCYPHGGSGLKPIHFGGCFQQIKMTSARPLLQADFIILDIHSLKVLCDILRTGVFPGRNIGPQPHLYFANDDLEYQTAFPSERLGMGAFRIALESIFNRIHPHALEYTSFGKPHPSVFKNAEIVLKQLMLPLDDQHDVNHKSAQCFKTLYMIGDNPAVDIRGARQTGHPWFSILTRTGVFKGKENHNKFPADLVVDTVEEAVDYILTKECAS